MRHYAESVSLPVSPKKVFSYADNHANFSSHMSKSSWMMGGGRMNLQMDAGKGRKIGSHIKLDGKVVGMNLFVDEIVKERKPPYIKTWQTVGKIRLLVIGHYRMGFKIKPDSRGSVLKVFIDYELPKSLSTRWLGFLFGGMYAKWCVQQMIKGIAEHFRQP